jgi:hypothetical protein
MLPLLAGRGMRAAEWSADAAAFTGEWKRNALALGIVLLICTIAWAIQEWDLRHAARAIGLFGVCLLLIAAVGAFVLIGVGLL